MGFVSTAPNRLADGAPLPLWRAPATGRRADDRPAARPGVFSPCARRASAGDWLALAGAALLLVVLPVAAALLARSLVVPGHPAQRQALGPAFWCAFALACLMALDAVQRLRLGLAVRAAGLLALAALFVWLALSGLFDDLSLARELASHRGLFAAALVRHLALVGAALALSLCRLRAARAARAPPPAAGGGGLYRARPRPDDPLHRPLWPAHRAVDRARRSRPLSQGRGRVRASGRRRRSSRWCSTPPFRWSA